MLRDLFKRFAPSSRRLDDEPATSYDPQEAGRLVHTALQLHGAGRLDEANALYTRALAREPGNIDALHFSGVVAFQQGRHEVAEALIAQALARNAINPAAHSNLGNVLVARGRPAEAEASYRRAIALQPEYVEACVNLGSMLTRQGRRDEAAACYESALAVAPGSAKLHFHFAALQADHAGPEQAIAGFHRALELKPDYAEAWNGLAIALLALARVDEAEGAYRQALALKPDFGQATFGYGLLKLMQGDYATGWPLYESRLDRKVLDEPVYARVHDRLDELHDVPRWAGAEASGRVLLAWTDQGLGDALMCLRYLPLLKKRGFARLVVQCDASLVPLVESIQGVDKVVSQESPPPFGEFDCHCPMSSLPYAFATRLDTIPAAVPYLRVPGAAKEQWAQRLADLRSPRVGVVWAGRRDFPKDALRSIRLEQFSALFEVEGVAFVSLQKGGEPLRQTGAALAVHDWMDQSGSLLDTAALIEQLDLVVAVDTGIVHLAGALGRPVWLLNRFESEWRWMLERADCPWYPTMRIFRQDRRGDWSGVLQRVAGALSELARTRSAGA